VKVLLALLAVLALLGAAGLSSLQAETFCSEYPTGFGEGSGSTSELSLTPPGWRCVYESPDGRRAVVEAGSLPWLLVALAGELGVAAWFARRRSAPARLAATTTVALAAVGACGLIGGFLFAFTAGCALGVPLAWLTDVAFARVEGGRRSRHRSVTAALAAGAAIFLAAFLALLLHPVVACAIAGAAIALATALVRPLRLRQQLQ
jgi:hypothetical protein